ncbi:glycosyltransferase family 2 protein [Lyngbya aestuarii]|uniref:glycosyltransferase family 2 protein n=1 Tax=Lyngbya aestuarii TaxID=118322 RepID=UPI00403DE844
MKPNNFDQEVLKFYQRLRIPKPRLTTLILVGIVVSCALIVVLWFAGFGEIQEIFAYLDSRQQNPPMWIEAPMVMTEFLLTPTIVLFLLAWGITKVSPQPRNWSRLLVIAILLSLTIRYLLWRCLSTLNLNDPLNGTFSLGLFVFELLTLFSSILQLFLMLKVKNRQREADRLSMQVADGSFNPSVDILIPTYNEPEFILKRTIIGCQAIDYEPKTVYVLDDTRRPKIANLAAELGCKYLTRADNIHAKAGNLNRAIPKTQGEFIVVFDADFVPTQNFLLRTLGFFKNEQVALVQTPQSFYNADPVARNLGLEDILTPEEEVFYRQLQPIKDGAGSVVCSGTSFVIRRSALEKIGGFVTDSLSEDFFTGIRLAAQGYRLVYLNEKLSAGLAAESIATHATQRLRWARGTLQAFFIRSNPLTIPGLSPLQRLGYFEGLIHWFSSLSTVFFLMMPLVYAFLGVIPIQATTPEVIYFFLPYYLTQITVFSWLNHRSRSAILSGVYGLVLAFPLALTVIQVMLNPFSQGFKVTPKGTQSDRFRFNWGLASPLLILFILTALSLWGNLGISAVTEMHMATMPPEMAVQMAQEMRGINLGWLWSAYSLITIGAALLILLDVPKLDSHEWFNLRRLVQIKFQELPVITKVERQSIIAQFPREIWGLTTQISEIGADIELTHRLRIPILSAGETSPVELSILEEKITLQGVIVQTESNGEFTTVRVLFEQLTLPQQRQLVKLLFCRPGQWQLRETPGELQSLWLLLKIFLKPKVLFERNQKVSAIKVSQI